MIISDYKPIGKGAMVASFNLTLPKWSSFQIMGLTLFESSGKRWITMPSRAYDDPENPGKKKYFQHCRFKDQEIDKKFKEAIIKALDEHVKTLAPVSQSMGYGSSKAPMEDSDDLPF